MKVSVDMAKLPAGCSVGFRNGPSESVVVEVYDNDGAQLETCVPKEVLANAAGDVTEDMIETARALGVVQ